MLRAMSRLRALLAGRQDFLQEVEEALPEGGVRRREAEDLLERCEQLGIEGVDKFSPDVSNMDKLFPVFAEIRTAILFARLGAKVRILKDQEFGRNRGGKPAPYTPDLIVSINDMDILVEVRQSSPGTPDLFTPLDRGIKERGLPIIVEYRLGIELSRPVFRGTEVQGCQNRVKEVVAEVIEKLSMEPNGSTGEIVIGEHRFAYKPSLDPGYVAGGVAKPHYVNIEEHTKKLLRDLEHKANKRPILPPKRRGTPFIVACENWEPGLSELCVLSTLTGMRTSYCSVEPPPIDHPPKVLVAWNSPWRRLLQEWDYGPDAACRLLRCGVLPGGPCNHNPGVGSVSGSEDHYGAFDGSKWAENLSGVLIIHGRHNTQWLPNPFAAEEIRELRLLDLGLSIEKLGSHHPDYLE